MKKLIVSCAALWVILVSALGVAADLPNVLDKTGLTGLADGTVSVPSLSFSSDPTLGIYTPSANVVGVTSRGKDAVQFTTNSASAVNYLSLVGTATTLGPRIEAQGGDTNISINLVPKGSGSVTAFGIFALNAGATFKSSVNLIINNAPSISSGFGTSPSITTNGSATYRLNVGTGGTATSGVVAMPTAPNGWNCTVAPFNPGAAQLLDTTVVTASTTTTVTVQNDLNSTGAATAWAASQVLIFQCLAY